MKYKELFKKIEATVSAIEYSHNETELIGAILQKVVSEYG
jgi:hypothetical protein